MKLYVIVILLLIVLLLTTKREPFTEIFGFSGYTKHVNNIVLNDERPNLSGYVQAEADVDNDLMQEFVLQANKEIFKRTNICTYIVETTSIKKYVNSENGKHIYECMFMVVKDSGFAYGFSVSATYKFENGKVELTSIRSQPLDVQTVSDVTPFIESVSGKDFVDYNLVKEAAVPNISELETLKNKFY
jgi:hypothetical protein